MTKRKDKLFFKDNIWSIDTLHRMWDVISDIGKRKYGLDFYPPRFELIDYEGMLNAYATTALPGLYSHWSFGEKYVSEYNKYKNNHSLAFEVVINSNPSVCYLMDSNTATMQALVIAHAAVGHSSFFKNNYLFKEHTNASTILPNIQRMTRRIKELETEIGLDEVSQTLDIIHQLQYYSFDKYKAVHISDKERKQMTEEAGKAKDSRVDKVLDFTLDVPGYQFARRESELDDMICSDNVLQFLRDNSINMPEYRRELIDMTLEVNQYLFPQVHTQLMNEGWASFWHYTLMNDLYNEGYLDEGSYWEFMQVHASVLSQPSFEKGHVGINPYKLGFDMYQDIKRISMEPTEEDREFFPDWAGNGDWLSTIKHAMKNYKDESFVEQYLSPKLIRDYKFIAIQVDRDVAKATVTLDHSARFYDTIIHEVANSYDFFRKLPQIFLHLVPDELETLNIHVFTTDYENKIVNDNARENIEDLCRELWHGEVEMAGHIGEKINI